MEVRWAVIRKGAVDVLNGSTRAPRSTDAIFQEDYAGKMCPGMMAKRKACAFSCTVHLGACRVAIHPRN